MTDGAGAYATIAEPCLQAIGSVLEPRSAIYVAGPLETGREFYGNPKSGPGRVEQEEIRRLNQARLTDFVAELRRSQPDPVIDPGPLRIAGWPAANYGRFFFEVIERFAREAWFLDGWAYSRGATSEYVHCVRHGIVCRDQHGAALDEAQARRLIGDAAAAIESYGHDASRFQARLEALAEA